MKYKLHTYADRSTIGRIIIIIVLFVHLYPVVHVFVAFWTPSTRRKDSHNKLPDTIYYCVYSLLLLV